MEFTQIAGALHVSNGTVTGSMFAALPTGYNSPSCADQWQALVVSGSVDASDNLTLTIPLGSTQGTATITAALNTNPEIPANGSLQITGGSCALSSTPIVITQYAPLTGTYTGTLYQTNPTTGALINPTTVTAVLTQSTTSDSYGEFLVSGTVTSTGAFAANYNLNGAVAFGGALLGVQQYPLLEGPFSPSASTISAILIVNALNTAYSGTLTRQ
jgi:hypothetical protein